MPHFQSLDICQCLLAVALVPASVFTYHTCVYCYKPCDIIISCDHRYPYFRFGQEYIKVPYTPKQSAQLYYYTYLKKHSFIYFISTYICISMDLLRVYSSIACSIHVFMFQKPGPKCMQFCQLYLMTLHNDVAHM